MTRRIGLSVLAVAAGLFVLTSTKVGSYVGTAWNKVRDAAHKQVPVEFELQRAQHELEQLIPDIKQELTKIAERQVAIETLKEKVQALQARLDEQKQTILAMNDVLEQGTQRVSYRSREYDREKLATKLANEVAKYKTGALQLKNEQTLLEKKEDALEKDKLRLEAIKQQKVELEGQIAALEAEINSVRLAQTESQFQFDDSRLSDIKSTLADIRKRLKVEQTTLELRGQFLDEESVPARETKPAAEVSREVRELFGEKANGRVADRK